MSDLKTLCLLSVDQNKELYKDDIIRTKVVFIYQQSTNKKCSKALAFSGE